MEMNNESKEKRRELNVSKMTETPQLTYCDEEAEDILLLCFANYFGRNKQKSAPALMEIGGGDLEDHCFTHLEFFEWKINTHRAKVRKSDKRWLRKKLFELQGPKRIFRNCYVNLAKWPRLNNLTGADGPYYPVRDLIAVRERNLRVLTIANFFYLINTIPTLSDIHKAAEVYMELRNGPFGRHCFGPEVDSS